MASVNRWTLRVTNPQTGERWVIEDSRVRAEKDLAKKLQEWSLAEDQVLVEWAEAEQ